MMRVVMFDLGGTLIDARQTPVPHAKEAVAAIAGFVAEDGKPIDICLVSDFTMADPPVTPAKISRLFKQYLAILEDTGLAPLFEPVSRHATLSTHAGALKPDRKVFETALKRLKVKAALSDCLLITENADHIAKAKSELGMHALQFGARGFTDWADGPALVAAVVAPHQEANQKAAIAAHLAAEGMEFLSLEPNASETAPTVMANCWIPVSLPDATGLEEVEVQVPVHVRLRRSETGAYVSSDVEAPEPEAVEAAKAYVKSLATHDQIAGRPGKPTPKSATHRITSDATGRPRLTRFRMSFR